MKSEINTNFSSKELRFSVQRIMRTLDFDYIEIELSLEVNSSHASELTNTHFFCV